MSVAQQILNSNLTCFDEIIPQLSSIETILSSASDSESNLAQISTILRSKRNIMDDIVAAYSTNFGSKKGKKKKPVVFLPNSPAGKDCEPSNRMSSFGYLAFVLSLINAVVNAANNVNNNQVNS